MAEIKPINAPLRSNGATTLTNGGILHFNSSITPPNSEEIQTKSLFSKRVQFTAIGFSDEDEHHSQNKYNKSKINEKVSKNTVNSELIISRPRESSRRLI